MERLLSSIGLPVLAAVFLGAGILHCSGMVTIGGYIYVKAGVGLIAIGIAILGYWALANRNSDYNF